MDRSAKVIDSFVRSLVRKNPGLTLVVWMSNGSTLGPQRFHPALKTELRRGIGGTELEADEARTRRDRDDVARALLAHDGQDRAGDIHRAEEARRQLPLNLLWRQLLEVARIKGPGVVDQHVDATEPVDRLPHRGLSIGGAGNVQLDDLQVIQITDGLGHGVGVPTGATTAWPAARRL